MYVDADHECRHQNFVDFCQNVDIKNFYVDTEQLSPSTPVTNIDSKTISYVDPENPWQSTPMQTSTYKTTSSLTHKIFGVDTRRVVVPLNQHLLTYIPPILHTLAATSHEDSLSPSSLAISWRRANVTRSAQNSTAVR